VSEQDHILDGFRLGCQIFDSGFRPSFIVGLWRGGSAVGIVVQECLATLGVETDHIALRTSYTGREDYQRVIQAQDAIRVHGKQYLLENINAEDRLLIVDDVYSSGRHTQAVIDSLAKGLKRNMPADIRLASIWVRNPPQRSIDNREQPDYFLHKTSDWLVLPYEMRDLSAAEIAEHKSFLTLHLERAGHAGNTGE